MTGSSVIITGCRSCPRERQVVFIAASYATLYLMYVKFKATYDRNQDTFRVEFLLIPVTILALILNHEFTIFEVSRLDGRIRLRNQLRP